MVLLSFVQSPTVVLLYFYPHCLLRVRSMKITHADVRMEATRILSIASNILLTFYIFLAVSALPFFVVCQLHRSTLYVLLNCIILLVDWRCLIHVLAITNLIIKLDFASYNLIIPFGNEKCKILKKRVLSSRTYNLLLSLAMHEGSVKFFSFIYFLFLFPICSFYVVFLLSF